MLPFFQKTKNALQLRQKDPEIVNSTFFFYPHKNQTFSEKQDTVESET